MDKRVVISDLGGVVVRLDFEPLKRELGARAGIEPDEAWRRVETDGRWKRHETGDMDGAGLAATISDVLGIELPAAEFLDHWAGVFPGEYEGIGALYREVKSAGHDLLVLSNTNADHVPHFTRVCPSLKLFDRTYYSHEIRARKPDAAAYRAVTEDWGAVPEACVFIDDRPENLRAAESFGMDTILAEGTESVRAGLVKLGVLE